MTARTANRLMREAAGAAKQAYCPYSRFHVGAALLAANGRVFRGCNVENASYGLTLCAERSALVAAVSAGQREFRALAVAADRPARPCGACLQVLAEFVGPGFPVYVGARAKPGAVEALTLGDLLPRAFRLAGSGHGRKGRRET